MGVNGIADTDDNTFQVQTADPHAQFAQAMTAAKADDGRFQVAQALPVPQTPPPPTTPTPGGPSGPALPPGNNVIPFPRSPPPAIGGGAAASAAEGVGTAFGLVGAGVVGTIGVVGTALAGLQAHREIMRATGQGPSPALQMPPSPYELGKMNPNDADYAAALKGAGYSPEDIDTIVAQRHLRGIPGDEDLSTTGSRTRTGMKNASSDPCRDQDGQRHHMVPAELMGSNQDFLREIGFKLDDGLRGSTGQSNLIRLPANDDQRADMKANPLCGDRTIHNGSHPEYTRAVNDRLSQIRDRFDKGNLTAEEAQTQVGTFLKALQRQLTSGQFSAMNDPALINAIKTMVF